MIDALIAGKLYGQPKAMTGKAGKPFATANLTAVAGDGQSHFVNVIAFDPEVSSRLLALVGGQAVALSGTLTLKAYQDKHGNLRLALNLVAQQVLTAYQVSSKRKAASDSADGVDCDH
jgi:hypothetical protein